MPVILRAQLALVKLPAGLLRRLHGLDAGNHLRPYLVDGISVRLFQRAGQQLVNHGIHALAGIVHQRLLLQLIGKPCLTVLQTGGKILGSSHVRVKAKPVPLRQRLVNGSHHGHDPSERLRAVSLLHIVGRANPAPCLQRFCRLAAQHLQTVLLRLPLQRHPDTFSRGKRETRRRIHIIRPRSPGGLVRKRRNLDVVPVKNHVIIRLLFLLFPAG